MTTKHWDENVRKVESKELKGWLDWEFIEVEYIRPQVSGDKNVYYLQHFLSRHVGTLPTKQALSLGCGGGNLERALIQLNAVDAVYAYDFSPESIRLAQELAQTGGLADRICYEVQDINTINLPPDTFNFAIAKMSLHHFENLEHIYEQIRRSLKPDGVFMFNEYIGPSRFQWTDLQLELMNKLLRLLPERNRWSAFNNAPLLQIDRPTMEAMIAMDPSESVRSAEIIPVLQKYFKIVEFKQYGGTLLHVLLTHVMTTFDLEDEAQVALLRMMFLYEQTLIGHNVLSSDFAYVVARPLPAAGIDHHP